MAFDWHGLITGRWDKKKFSALYLPCMFLSLCCWTIARMLYPVDDGYCMDVCRISRQGNLSLNPIGGWFFVVGTGFFGVLFLLYSAFAYHRLSGRHKIPAHLFLLCGYIGGIGLFLVGICPEGSCFTVQKTHDIGTALAFGGAGCAVGFSFLALSMKLRDNESWPSKEQFYALFLIMFHFAVLAGFISSVPVLHWFGFSAILAWQLGLFMVLPDYAKTGCDAKNECL